MTTQTKSIHPSLQKLGISERAKNYFNKLEFYEIIEDPVIVSKKEEVNEAQANCWSFSVDDKKCTHEDLKNLYQSIIESRRKSIQQQKLKRGMIFYTWYDAASGNFYFSLIQPNEESGSYEEQLPFKGRIKLVESIDYIIEDFMSDSFKGRIPVEAFHKSEGVNKIENNALIGREALNVWTLLLNSPFR